MSDCTQARTRTHRGIPFRSLAGEWLAVYLLLAELVLVQALV